jgi:gamma-glutamylcyclotransferase (GGCT)/AIG2-like uncharacterized protein YtfP
MSKEIPVFVYGTLRPDYLRGRNTGWTTRISTKDNPARIKGRLFNLGSFPGLKLEEPFDSVKGHVVFVSEETLCSLDAYEGYQPHAHHLSLYLRVMADVMMGWDEHEKEETMQCQVYVYNQTPNESSHIQNGDWMNPHGESSTEVTETATV